MNIVYTVGENTVEVDPTIPGRRTLGGLNSELINTGPKLPISEKAFESGISLPSSYNISKKQLKYCRLNS